MLEVAMHFLTPKHDRKSVITTARLLQKRVGDPEGNAGVAQRYVVRARAFLQFDDEAVTP
jgi:hypothetical protein